MNYDLVICGVGGQGVLSIAWVIDHAAHEGNGRQRQAQVPSHLVQGLNCGDVEAGTDELPAAPAAVFVPPCPALDAPPLLPAPPPRPPFAAPR